MSLFESGFSTGAIDFRAFFDVGADIGGVDGPDVPTYASRIVIGGWPMTQGMSERRASMYLRSYIEDSAKFSMDGGANPERVKALLRAVSRNISTEAAVRRLASETNTPGFSEGDETDPVVSLPTARKYLDGLSGIFVLEELQPWSTHIRARIRQRVSPKWHFIDPSLATASLQLSSKQLLGDPNALGYFFESLCIRDLRVFAEYLGGHVYYYRDEKNLEVDAIVELFDGRWAGFEIKLGGDRFIEEGARNLLRLHGKLSEAKQADMTSLNVVTAGNVSYRRADGVNVVSIGHIGIR
jgi:predicted AAA+ superfamily ATPase